MSPATPARLATVVLITMGVATPLVAHAIGSACWIWLPAHWPALLAGLALGLRTGALVGLATLIVELVARPALAASPAAAEILVYGLVAGLAGTRARTIPHRYAGLVAAMLAGRVAYAVVAWIALTRPLEISVQRLLFFPWPGIVVQLVALPLVATLLVRVLLRPIE
jgi:hypothetical protein